MGRPSDRRRSARRPGRNERARVKKKYGSRKCSYRRYGPGGLRLSFDNLGPKKAARFFKWLRPLEDSLASASTGEPSIAESNSRGL
jgi:hypothetical protein